MRRAAALAAFVIAAMALGRAITDLVPTGTAVDTPFTVEGRVGEPVDASFAEVEVTKVAVTPTIMGNPATKAGGRWVVVDTRITALRQATVLYGATLVDASGTHHLASVRGADCTENPRLPTGIPWTGSFCFDVERSALDGARILLSRGAFGDNGDGYRRDSVADIDLGLEDPDALWEQTEAVNVGPAIVGTEQEDAR